MGGAVTPREQMQERIRRNVEVCPCSGCWIWARRANNGGYGVMSVVIDGRHVKALAHRVAYWAFKRAVPRGRVVAHSYRCSSQLCCNPAHLRATTQSNNERDKRRAKLWRLRTFREIHPPVYLQEAA